MTAADRLRALAAKATPGPWHYDHGVVVSIEMSEPVTGVYGPQCVERDSDGALIALAPEMALLAADMADALARLHAWDVMTVTDDGRYWREDVIAPLLSRFEALTQEQQT